MTSCMLELLLETGEYSLGRPGKSSYLKFTYVIENGQIVIYVDPDHPDKKYAVDALTKVLIKKYRMLHGKHFIKSVDNNTVTITHTGYTLLEELSQNNSELAYALEMPQFVQSLLKNYKDTEEDKRKVENIIKAVLIDPHPLFKKEQTSNNLVYITVHNKIKEPLASQIRRGIINIVQFLRSTVRVLQQNQFNIEESENRSNTKYLRTSTKLIDQLKVYIGNGHLSAQQASSAYIYHEPSHVSQIDYKDAHAKFKEINTGADIETLKITLDEYAQLVSRQLTVKEKHAYKLIAFRYILNIFKNLNDIEHIAELFQYLLSLQLKIDIHRHSFDGLFNKYNTNSWQELLGEIRDNAFLKLKMIVDESESKIDQTDAIALLEKSTHMKLFTKHRTNWISFTHTRAEQDIYAMLQKINAGTSSAKLFKNPFSS